MPLGAAVLTLPIWHTFESDTQVALVLSEYNL